MSVEDKKEGLVKIWDNFREIGEVRQSDKLKLVVAIAAVDGIKYISVRQFYYRVKTNDWQVSRKGIVVPIEIPINNGAKRLHPMQSLLNIIAVAMDRLKDFPIEGSPVYGEGPKAAFERHKQNILRGVERDAKN